MSVRGASSGAVARVVPCSSFVTLFSNDSRVFPVMCPGGVAGAGLATACWPDQKLSRRGDAPHTRSGLVAAR